MATRPRGLAVLAPLLAAAAGCQEAPQTWMRVVYKHDGDIQRYMIAQADPATNTCVRVALRQPYDYELESEMPLQYGEVDVELVGVEGLIFDFAVAARPSPESPDSPIAFDCTTREWSSDVLPPAPRISGKLEFSELASAADPAGPCRVDFDLTVRSPVYTYNEETGDYDMSEELYEIQARDLAIYAEGCPPPADFEASFAGLDAAYAELDGIGTVVVASWDPSDEVCAWARLLSSGDGLGEASSVEAPGSWAYGGVRVARLERDACTAALLVDPRDLSARYSASAGPLGSRGAVGFGATVTKQVETGTIDAPCSVDVDLKLHSYGDYHWVPQRVTMKGQSVPVAGACD